MHPISAVFARPDPGSPGLLPRELLPLARGQVWPWTALVTPTQWASLDAGDLTALLLTPTRLLATGEQPLQAAAIAGLCAARWQLRDAPRPWLRPADPAQRESLLALLTTAPALLPDGLLADLGRGLSPDDLPAAGLALLLTAELAAGTLWRRQFQADALAAAAAAPGVFGVLVAATERGALPAHWAERLLADTDPRQQLGIGLAVLAQWPDPGRWGGLLLGLLRRLPTGAAPAAAAAALATLTLPRDLDLCLALLALGDGPDWTSGDMLPASLLAELGALADPAAQRQLLMALGNSGAGVMGLAALADPAGRLRLPWLPDHAPRLLADAALVARLGPEALVGLALGCAGEPDQAIAWTALDRWMGQDPPRTATALIDADAWATWRARATPAAAARRALALLWLGHPAHAACPAPPSLATWRAVIEDLGADLDAETLRALLTPAPRWPWLPGLALEQMGELAARCRDLGALAVLAEGLRACPQAPPPMDVQRLLLAAWPPAGALSAAAFAWLRRDLAPPDQAPTLAESDLLLERAGERLPEALRARVVAVVGALAHEPAAALAAADRPRLWARPGLHAALIERLAASPSLPDWTAVLDQHLASGAAVARPEPPGANAPDWQHCLLQAGRYRLLALLAPAAPQSVTGQPGQPSETDARHQP